MQIRVSAINVNISIVATGGFANNLKFVQAIVVAVTVK